MKTKKLFIILLFYTIIVFSIFPKTSYQIILLETMPVKTVLEHSKWFLDEISAINKKNKLNIKVDVINIEGDKQKGFILLRQSLKNKKTDLVVTNATLATQVAYQELKGTNIPIVFFTVADPVGAGVIKKIGVPTGENITGKVVTLSRQTKIIILEKLLSQLKYKRQINIGYIHSSYPSSVGELKELKKIFKAKENINLIPYQIPYQKVPEGIPSMIKECRKAIKDLENKVDFWYEPLGPLGELTVYTETLIKYSKNPICFGNKKESVKSGALLFISPDRERYGRDTAQLALIILQGENAGNIPPLPPDYFKLGVNLSTAIKLKIVIPQDIMELAGENVYK